MHRKQNTDLIPVDTELEKTLRSLRKIKKAENSTMADERQDQNEVHREAARSTYNSLLVDPNEHLGRFLRMANTVKLNGVRPEVIKLHLFPFSLRDTAATWYESLPYGSVDTWEELVEAYLGRFFPPSLISERRREIIVFQQGKDESLYVAWNRPEDSNGHSVSCSE